MKPCIRCLLSEIPDEAALAAAIRERIEGLPAEERAGKAERIRRLELCRECGRLNRGTCAACGCYVELRAAKKKMSCPEVPPKW